MVKRIAGCILALALSGCVGPMTMPEEPEAQEKYPALNESASAPRRERQTLALLSEANAEFARGRYASAIAVAKLVAELDPGNSAARDLMDDARMALRRRTWEAIGDQDKKSIEDERVRLRLKAVFPGAIVQYPADDVWQEIKGRPGAE